MGAPCAPCNTSTVLAAVPIFYIARAANPAVELRFRRAGACGRIEHVPALMAQDVFPAGTQSPVQFRASWPQLDGCVDGFRFGVRRWPLPQHSVESCPPPNLAELGILLSHLRAMAVAHRRVSAAAPDARPRAVLIVEEDVDLRLVRRWLSATGSSQTVGAPLTRALGGLDAVVAALPAGWGLAQLALISTARHFARLRARLAAGERVVPHAQLVGERDGRNEGWSTAAYAASPAGLRAMLEAYWPGGEAGARERGGAHAAPDGVLELSAKPCVRADYLLSLIHI